MPPPGAERLGREGLRLGGDVDAVSVQLLLIPVVGAFIGWVTNVAAVRLLFWPLRPIRIPGTPWSLQGVFPRRRRDITGSIARVMEQELLRPSDLAASLDATRYRVEAVDAVQDYVTRRFDSALPRLLPERVRDALTSYVRDWARREAQRIMADVAERMQRRLETELRVGAILGERLERLDLAAFEQIIVRLVGRELGWIEILGGLMGFAIGLVQMLLAMPWG